MDDNTDIKKTTTRDRKIKMEDKFEKMKIKKVVVALGLGIIIIVLFFGGVNLLSFLFFSTKNEISIPTWIAIDGETYTNLHINVYDKNSIENKDLCYDLVYIPDREIAGRIVRDYYTNIKFNDDGTTAYSWGEEYIGYYGASEFKKLYRTNGNDRITIRFYDGTNVTKELMKTMVVTYNIKNSNHSEAVYDCYFDGVLRASNLTYEQLKNHVCDDWKRICKR